MPNDRIDAALTLIAAIAGDDDRNRTDRELQNFNLGQIDQSLSIGGFRGPFKSEPETFRRSLVRAVLLVKLARGTVATTAAAQNITSLMNKNTAQLQRELLSLFPYKPYRGSFEKRRYWDPTNFTLPSHHSDSKYMYMVHTLMREPSRVADYNLGNAAELENFEKLRLKYLPYAQVSTKNKFKPSLNVDFLQQYLDNPHIIRSNIISSSVISEAKHATYYPLGFIMSVPPECIYITSPRDVAVANRTTDILNELQTKHGGTAHTIMTPQEVLAQTTGIAGALHYNEVVVVGTAPEGKQVSVIGIFVKTDGRGNLYVGSQAGPGNTVIAQPGPFVDAKTQKMVEQCAKKFNLPIVALPDTTSQPSTTRWPFGGAQTILNARARSGTI